MAAAADHSRTHADPSSRPNPQSKAREFRPTESADRPEHSAAVGHAFERFRACAAGLGYDRIAFVPVTPAAQHALGLTALAPAISINVPDEWIRHYMAEKYHAVDPVLLQTPLQSGPLVWDDMLMGGQLSPKQRRVLIESREAGLFNGVSIPLHGPGGETYVISLASERTALLRPVPPERLQVLATCFLIAHLRAIRRQAAGPYTRITDRERECLTWTARGKSAWTIGRILGVSEHTVNFHMKQSMAKLGATNRMQAIVSALRLGLILP